MKHMWKFTSTLFKAAVTLSHTHTHQPFHLGAPQDVLLLVHVDGEVLVLALLDGVGPGGDGPHLVELRSSGRNNVAPQ